MSGLRCFVENVAVVPVVNGERRFADELPYGEPRHRILRAFRDTGQVEPGFELWCVPTSMASPERVTDPTVVDWSHPTAAKIEETAS